MKRFLPKPMEAFNSGDKNAIDRSTSDLGFKSFLYETNHNIPTTFTHLNKTGLLTLLQLDRILEKQQIHVL